MNIKNKPVFIVLFLIVLFAGVLRLYKLDSVPPSISWDEAAVGYNAYSIANYGRDEYGKLFPLFFRSFADDKHPVHVYFTALSVKLMGLSDFSIRFPAALFGILNVVAIFFLVNILFENKVWSLIASLSIAISPYNLHFSRFNHEANFLLFFFILGLILFFYSVKRHHKLLPLSVACFGLSFLAYHSGKIVVPITVVVLLILFWKKIITDKINLISATLVGIVFIIIVSLNPQLLGFARVQQTSLSKEQINNTALFKSTSNESLGRLNLIFNQYLSHFTPQFLFISGDKNPRLSSQSTGEFYLIDVLFLIMGLIFLVLKKSKEAILILVWFFIAPLPSSLVAESPHAARASLIMGSFNIVSAAGLFWFTTFFKKNLFKGVVVIVVLVVYIFSLIGYLKYYFGEYVERYAIEWQYGHKQIVDYVKSNPKYESVYMTEVRSQPYIFFLFYLKTPLPEFTNTAIFNNSQSKSYNTISGFSKYFFGGWNPLLDSPQKGVLYILTPSEYDGLMNRDSYEVRNLIKYPNGTNAFYLVEII